MTTRDGKLIISCPMAANTLKSGNCGTCLYKVSWQNCRWLNEGDPAFCDARDVITEEGGAK